jgi:hypothetical protein
LQFSLLFEKTILLSRIEKPSNMENGNTQAPSGVEGFCVAIRMRPLNHREKVGGEEAVFRCTTKDNRISQFRDNQVVDGQTYFYDKVFDEHATTADVYTHVGRDAVANVAAGINGTIFACKNSILTSSMLQTLFNGTALTHQFLIYISRWSNKLRQNTHNARW